MLTQVERKQLEDVKQDLKDNPKGFNMDAWSMCIASRIVKLEYGHKRPEHVASLMENHPKYQPLFSLGQWPTDLATRYCLTRPGTAKSEDPAALAVEAVERFLEADGKAASFANSNPAPKLIPQPQLAPAFIPSKRQMVAAKVIGTTVGSFMLGVGGVTLIQYLMG